MRDDSDDLCVSRGRMKEAVDGGWGGRRRKCENARRARSRNHIGWRGTVKRILAEILVVLEISLN